MNVKKSVIYIIKMLMGGGLYFLIELIFRGYSHWTMFILGGLCFVVCGIVNDISKGRLAIWQEMVWCMIIITLLEFAFGIVDNGVYGLHVWDYSRMPFQVLGQICVPFMLLWYIISYPAILLNVVFDNIAVRLYG